MNNILIIIKKSHEPGLYMLQVKFDFRLNLI